MVGQEPPPAVHAILFYSPSCPHCHEVISECLLPMQERYGNRLVLLGLDTSRQFANNLFYEILRHFAVPQDRWAVPFLLVGDVILVGGMEVPTQFPGIVEEGLASGGIDFPDVPVLLDFLREQGLLDPQYPNRRVAPRTSLPEEEPATDSSAVADTLAARDTLAVTDSAGAAPLDSVPPRGVDTGQVRSENPATVVVADTVRERASDPGAVPGDTAAGTSRPQAVPGSGGADTAAGAPAALLPGTPRDTSSIGLVPRGGGRSADGPVGLADAVRELESMTWRDRFLRDTAGNSLSVLVLVGMLASLVLTGYPPRVSRREWPRWVVPALVVAGVGVAAYLSFVEVTQVEAVCGPVGDCNTVNQSEYAFLFGVLPVGVLGLVGYGLILVLWALGLEGTGWIRSWAGLGLWGAALLGTIFSIYLTFLEPFVIGATCLWCLSSAVIMTLLLWASAPTAARAWPRGSPSPEGG